MTTSTRRGTFRTWLTWTLSFLAFPLAGLLGTLAVGRVDSPLAALFGGLIAGAIIGLGQAIASRRRLDLRKWIPATSLGMGFGLLAAASAVGFRTSLADLALMGAINGLVIGAAQALALPARVRSRIVWAAGVTALWSVGWVVTTAAMIDVDAQFTNFGALGAVTFSAAAGLLLQFLLPLRVAIAPRSSSQQIGTAS